MIIRVRTEQRVKVLTLKANDWRMDNGRSGTSYKAGILSDGDIDKVKVTPELFRELEEDREYVLSGVLSVNNGNAGFVFDSILSGAVEPGKPGK